MPPRVRAAGASGNTRSQTADKPPHPRSSTPTRQWSPQQGAAIDDITHWYSHPAAGQVFHLEGLAGVGKTELVVRLQDALDGYLQYASLTGKAASVLRARGADNATTLHSLLYGKPIVTEDELIWKPRQERPAADLLICDEISMVERRLGRDLLNTGIRVLVTGDGNQLPPVNGPAFFNQPDVCLTDIHRQGADAQPLHLATLIRQGEPVQPERCSFYRMLEADVVICGLNRTRRDINYMIRRGRQGTRNRYPVVGDRLVALKNNHQSGIYNGTLWTITAVEIDDLHLHMQLVDDIGAEVSTTAHMDGFYPPPNLDPQDQYYKKFDLFDYGYCLTAHKAQGSEWDRVAVIDETQSVGFSYIKGRLPLAEFTRRWLYSSVTRAKSHVDIMRAPHR
jgi:exodeoxyribonuclease-5